MEQHHVLDLSCPINLYSLHFVYGPLIQNCLRRWQSSHNNHPIRTEGNKTPLQLWYAGSMSFQGQNSTAMNNLFRRQSDDVNDVINTVLREYDLEEPADITVVLPRYIPPMTDAEMEEFKRVIIPSQDSQCEKIDIYASAVRFIKNCVNPD